MATSEIDLGANLKALRFAKNDITQKALEAETGVSFRTIQNAEKGLTDMGAGALVALADAFDVSVDRLVRKDGPKISQLAFKDALGLVSELLSAAAPLDEDQLRHFIRNMRGASGDLTSEKADDSERKLDSK